MLKDDFPEKKALMEKYGYSDAELLSPEILSVNLVSSGVVTHLEVSPVDGVAVDTFDKVINDLGANPFG